MRLQRDHPDHLDDLGALRLVQLSDTHLTADPEDVCQESNADANLRRVLAVVAKTPPDAVILTGDLSQDETEASYRRLAELVCAAGVDTWWTVGNHDDPAAARVALVGPGIHPEKAFHRDGWRVVLLDSRIPGRVPGRLRPAELERLDSQLHAADQAGQHAVVALHHPPHTIGSSWLAPHLLENPAELFDVLDRHHSPRLVLSGHVHQAFRWERRAVVYLTCPSAAYQFEPGADLKIHHALPPGGLSLQLNPDGSFQTAELRAGAP